MLVGDRAHLRRDLPSKELTQTFRRVSAAVVRDYMGRNCTLYCLIRLMPKSVKNMCGPVLTVQNRGGDNLSFHKASDMAQEGDATVMVASFCDTNSITGENIVTNVTFKKLGGLVLDASIRDIKGISKMELPVYVASATPGGPHRSAPGKISVPISCGSCFIHPGDITVENMDGVVAVLLGDAEAVLEATQKHYAVDMHSQEEAAAGPWNRGRIDKGLETADVGTMDSCYRR